KNSGKLKERQRMDPKQDKVRNEGVENASSEEIRSDIKGTRREMDETFDEIIDIFRSSPGGNASRGQIAGTSKRLGRTVANELREHPLAALLVGAGLVWWIVDATTSDGDEEEIYPRRHRRALPVGS